MLHDQTRKVIVNIKGRRGEISDGLREIIRYMSKGEVTGEYSHNLHTAVEAVKSNEERKERYMNMYALIDESYEEGQRQGKRQGQRQGKRQGFEAGTLRSIRQIITKMKMTPDQAMEILDVPVKDQAKYLAKL